MYEIKDGDISDMPSIGGRGKGWRKKYPFGDMEVGQYIDAESDGGKCAWMTRPAQAAKAYGRRNGMKFGVRYTEDPGVVRIWRLS